MSQSAVVPEPKQTVEDVDEAAATATTVPLFCQTYLDITITSTSASRFL